MFKDQHTNAAMLGGTLRGIFNALQSGDLLRTVILTSVSAAVSYTVSVILKTVSRRMKNKGTSRINKDA